MKSPLLAPIAAAVMAAAAHAQTPVPQAAATPVAVIVKVPKPC